MAEPKARNERERALGDVSSLPPPLRRAFRADSAFQPLPPPGPDDWRAIHPESGQTFDDFASSHANRPTQERRTLYLQPLGAFDPEKSPDLAALARFAEAFFMLPVRLLPALDLAPSVTSRKNPESGQRQLLTSDILAELRKRLPADAFCMLGITMTDLYPDPSWHFVFGQASRSERVGVYSFARYDPSFYGEEAGPERKQLLFVRSARVLAHETGHMFGLRHCVYYRCVLNGSNQLKESDARPLHLCPIDLRKLQSSIGFDVAQRYQRLESFWREQGERDEAAWLAARLRAITTPDSQKNQ